MCPGHPSRKQQHRNTLVTNAINHCVLAAHSADAAHPAQSHDSFTYCPFSACCLTPWITLKVLWIRLASEYQITLKCLVEHDTSSEYIPHLLLALHSLVHCRRYCILFYLASNVPMACSTNYKERNFSEVRTACLCVRSAVRAAWAVWAVRAACAAWAVRAVWAAWAAWAVCALCMCR